MDDDDFTFQSIFDTISNTQKAIKLHPSKEEFVDCIN